MRRKIVLIFCIGIFSIQNLSFLFIELPDGFSSNVPIPQKDSNNPKNILLFIGDGMGMNQIEFGHLIEYGLESTSPLFTFPDNTTVSTNNIYGSLTDSAAAATAIASGVKTRNRRIGMDSLGKKNLTSILEIAQDYGYATGLIATCHLTHATPASFYAHQKDRGNYLAIGNDLVHSSIDLLFGGGSDEKYLGSYVGDFLQENYQYLNQASQLNQLNFENLPTIGLFSEGSFPPWQDLNGTSEIPNLQLMTKTAISVLNQTSQPFFLMIEGSQIDWAGHDNDPIYLAHQMIEFEKTIQYVKTFGASNPDWQILVTADHETGGFSFTSPVFTTETPRFGDSLSVNQSKRTLRAQEITTDWSTSGHTSQSVILAGMGPYTNQIPDTEHHIDIFGLMYQAITNHPVPEQSSISIVQFWILRNLLWLILGILGTISLVVIRFRKSIDNLWQSRKKHNPKE